MLVQRAAKEVVQYSGKAVAIRQAADRPQDQPPGCAGAPRDGRCRRESPPRPPLGRSHLRQARRPGARIHALDLAELRRTLDRMVPAEAQVSRKRWANLRSDLVAPRSASRVCW